MDERYACHCGLYCEHCPVRAKVGPAAKVLFDEMKRARFEDIIDMLPNGGQFWIFLKGMAESGAGFSCREGCGNPECAMRLCAREKGVAMCARCESYPCRRFEKFFADYPILERDNALLRERGMAEWAKLQDKRRAEEFVYPDSQELA